VSNIVIVFFCLILTVKNGNRLIFNTVKANKNDEIFDHPVGVQINTIVVKLVIIS